LTNIDSFAIIAHKQQKGAQVEEPVELHCTQADDGTWLVWFPHPLGGMNVLETFNNETEAREFWQQQMDSADFGEEE